MSSAPTLILIHGSWHTPAYWDKARTILEMKGYKCIAPQLLFTDIDLPITSIAPAIESLRRVIASEIDAGNDVVVVNHSFGGMVGCSAIKGFTRKNQSNLKHNKSGHVLGLIQTPAFAPRSNTALIDLYAVPGYVESLSSQDQVRPSKEGWSELLREPGGYFYNDLPPEEAQELISRLVKFSFGLGMSSDGVYAGWLDVPVWYLFCTLDQAMTLKGQEIIVQICRDDGADVTTRVVEAGHSPAISKTEDVVQFVEDAIASFRTKGSR
ncbi:Alpha/beta hydrolase fold-1 [Exophiala viscosa]|uniref:Alpha/beta hydrolase fold-1 n=1 Tax=Exophiala viscosa TaxID=2486360 RepID=A0AAN6E338_9EURO|nr:Alpha/beta hydrolase fold-1 [Exophiala viscosa]KAI1630213.1 Alpha/beta hydrolase fold-1 [Exophiala viscosa]